MSSIVAYEDFHLIIDYDPIGELEIPRATELAEDIAHHVKHDDSHHFALYHNDPTPIVCSYTPRMLQYIGAELPDEMPILGE